MGKPVGYSQSTMDAYGKENSNVNSNMMLPTNKAIRPETAGKPQGVAL